MNTENFAQLDTDYDNKWTTAGHKQKRNLMKRKPVQEMEKSHAYYKFGERMKMTNAIYKEQLKQTEEIKQKALERNGKQNIEEVEKTREIKEERRKQYQKRQQERPVGEAMKLTSKKNKMSLNTRLFLYMRWHNCPHDLKHNIIQRDGKDNYKFTCSHALDKRKTTVQSKCWRCGKYGTNVRIKSHCGCFYTVCEECSCSMYEYDYDGRKIQQYYDKHSFSRDTIVINMPGEEERGYDVNYITNLDKTNMFKLTDIEKKNFFREFEGKSQISYADVIRFKSKQKEGEKNEIIETTPEGGMISSVTDPLISIKDKIIEKIKEFSVSMYNKIREIRNKIKAIGIVTKALETLQNLLKAFKYFIKIIISHIVHINPMTLMDLWIDGFTKRGLVHLAAIAIDISRAELTSIEKFVMLMEERELNDILYNLTTKDLGIIDVRVKDKLMQLCESHDTINYKNVKIPTNLTNAEKEKLLNPYRYTTFFRTSVINVYGASREKVRTIINNLSAPSIKTFKERFYRIFRRTPEETQSVLNTTPESSLGNMLGAFFDTFPSRFSVGVKILRGACEYVRPILLTTKAIGDVTKLMNQLKNFVLDKIFETHMSPKDFIAHKMHEEGNPIFELVTTYIAYKTSILTKSSEDSSTKLRGLFYTRLSQADLYMKDKGQLSTAWFDFCAKIQRNIDSTIPEATKREYEPLCLSLMGPAGTGKSTIWKALLAQLFLDKEEQRISEEMEKITYTWNQASEFQTGMTDKKVVLFDDFCQNIGEVNEQLAVIGLCTTAPFPVNIATISGKEVKGMCASPDAVVICTNVTVERATQLMASKEALERRIDFGLKTLKRYDPEHPDEEIFEIVNCVFYKDLIGKKINFKQAKTLCTVIYNKKRHNFKKVEKVVNKLHEVQLLADLGKIEICDVQNIASQWQLSEDLKQDMIMFAKLESGYEKDQLLTIAANYLIAGTLVGLPVILGYAFLSSTYTLTSCLGTKMIGGLTEKVWVREFLSSVFGCLATTLISFGAIFALYKMTIRDESGQTKTRKGMERQTNMPPISTSTESGEMDDLSTLFEKATGSIRNLENGTYLNCIFVRGQFILLPKHFFYHSITGEMINEGTSLEIIKSNWNGVARTFNFEKKRLVEVKGHYPQDDGTLPMRADIILYELDHKIFNAEQDITRHFWNGERPIENVMVYKYDFEYWDSQGRVINKFRTMAGEVTSIDRKTMRLEDKTFVYNLIAEATYQSRSSSCGSIIRMGIKETPILGIHVARRGEYSYFHFVTRQALIEATSRGIVLEKGTYRDSFKNSLLEYVLPERSNLILEGINDRSVHQPIKTDLTPSDIYEVVSFHTTEPAVLHSQDNRLLPEFRGLNFQRELFKGYRVSEGRFELHEIEHAHESMKEETKGWISNAGYVHMLRFDKRFSKYNFEDNRDTLATDVLNGFINLPGNTRVDRTTSAGFPYSLKGIKREHLISYEYEKYIPRRDLELTFLEALDNIRNGIVPYLPFILTFKDERVKLSKIVTPKTRIFACASIIHYMIMRFYFYDYIYLSQDTRKCTWSMPTMDRLSVDWNEYATKMLEVGNKGFDFDFKYWDRTIQKPLIVAAVDIMLMDKELPEKEYKALVELISGPTMIWDKYIFRSNGMVMSGSLLTYSINCVINEMLHRSAYFYLVGKIAPHLANTREYHHLVRGMRGGDDTVTVVDDRILEWYNGETVGKFFNNRGLEVTATDKSINIPKFNHFLQLSFLKNTTKYLDTLGLYIPQPEIASLKESMNWIRINKNNTSKEEATQENIICSLRGLYFYGKTVYNEIRNEILKEKPRYKLPSYRELDQTWYNFRYFPGSHADYALREDERNIYEITLDYNEKERNKNILNKMNQSAEQYKQTKTQNKFEIIQEIGKFYHQIEYESGYFVMDKEQIGMNELSKEIVHSDIGPTETLQVENNNITDPEKTQKTRIGATIQDAKQNTVVPVRVGSIKTKSKNDRADAYLNDISWDLNKLAHKFSLVKSVDWTTEQVTGTIISTLEIPKDILVTPAQKTPFDVTKLWKCTNVRMKVVLKSSPFYAGSLGLGFTPFSITPDYRRMINMGALIQKASQNEGLEFTIPFRYPYGFLDITKNEPLGKFCIFVISPLRTGTGNPQSVSMAVYAAMENNEFKLPDVIPPTRYISHKMDKHSFITTIPESGNLGAKKGENLEGLANRVGMNYEKQMNEKKLDKSNTYEKTVLCDVNQNPSQMDKTTLCAGSGVLGRTKIGHFQDAPNSMMQIAKRWRIVGNYGINIDNLKRAKLTMSVGEIYLAAMNGLQNWFGLMRGSVNMRIIIKTGTAKGQVFLSAREYAPDVICPTVEGIHYFDADQIAQFTIPWTQRTFTSYSDATLMEGVVHVYLDNFNLTASDDNIIEISVCLGDDFHMGVYLGAPTQYYLNSPLLISRVDEPIPIGVIPVVLEAGIIENLDRVIETTLPIVDKISELSELLDATPLTVQPTPLWMRKIPYSIASDNVQYTERLITTNHNGMSLPDTECFGSATAETNIHNILTDTKSLSYVIDWGEDKAQGDVLAKFTVGPLGEQAFPGDTINTMATIFNYWTGGMLFIFDIIATELHRGQLYVTFTPNSVDDITYASAPQTYFTTIDLAEGRGTVCLYCPYLSEYPYRESKTIEDNIDNSNSSGKVTVFVQNPLRASTTVAPTVSIVVYTACATDFNFGVYGRSDI